MPPTKSGNNLFTKSSENIFTATKITIRETKPTVLSEGSIKTSGLKHQIYLFIQEMGV